MAATTANASNDERQNVVRYNEEDFPSYFKLIKATSITDLTFPLLSSASPDNAIEIWFQKHPAAKVAARALNAPNTLMSDDDLKAKVRADPMLHGPAIIQLLVANNIGTANTRKELQKQWGFWAAAEISIYRTVAKSLKGHE